MGTDFLLSRDASSAMRSDAEDQLARTGQCAIELFEWPSSCSKGESLRRTLAPMVFSQMNRPLPMDLNGLESSNPD